MEAHVKESIIELSKLLLQVQAVESQVEIFLCYLREQRALAQPESTETRGSV